MTRETELNTGMMAKLAGAGRAPRTIVIEDAREITFPDFNLGQPGSVATSVDYDAMRKAAMRLAPARVLVFNAVDEDPFDD